MPDQSPASSSPEELLSSLLSAFGTLPPKAKRVSPPRVKKLAEILPLPQAFAHRKTGYTVWKAISRVFHVQEQECTCCGGKVSFIKAEFFQLENGRAHATWLRPEGYGIEAPEDLPFVYIDLPPEFTPTCPSCRTSPFGDLESLFHPRQRSLSI